MPVSHSGPPLPERFIAFDVETPNCANDRISAIGITVVDHGEIAEQGSHQQLLSRGGIYYRLYHGMFELS